MRNLAIAYGNNRQAKTWVNKTIRFADLKERLKVTIRTAESAEEYAKMSKAQRDAAKDHGGFVAGVLMGGRRKIDTVEVRSMLHWTVTELTLHSLPAMKLFARMLRFCIPRTAARPTIPAFAWYFLLREMYPPRNS